MEETKEMKEKRMLKEEKEMKYRLSQKNRRQGKPYFIVLMVIFCIIYIVDEVTSNIGSATRTGIVTDFFYNTGKYDTFDEANGAYGLISLAFYCMLLIAPFYKSLADKFGRKLFLALNTIGMGVGMLIVMTANNIVVLFVGLTLMQFVTPNDMQVMYIMETAPEKHRVKLTNLAKAIGLAGVSLIALFRYLNTDSAGALDWQKVYLIPVIMAIVVGVGCYIFADETPVFVEKRINYLRMTDEERKAEEEQKKKEKVSSKGKVLQAFKYVFKTKQLRYLAIAGMLLAASTGITSYYETILSSTYQGDARLVTIPIMVFPFANAAITFLAGFLVDGIGRKKSTIYLGSLALFCVILFMVGASLHWPLVLVGIFYGCFLGGIWSISDLIFLVIPTESSPTDYRASILGALSLLFSVGCGIAVAITGIASMIGGINMGIFCICYGAPLLATSILIILFKVKETKGTDLEKVTIETNS